MRYKIYFETLRLRVVAMLNLKLLQYVSIGWISLETFMKKSNTKNSIILGSEKNNKKTNYLLKKALIIKRKSLLNP